MSRLVLFRREQVLIINRIFEVFESFFFSNETIFSIYHIFIMSLYLIVTVNSLFLSHRYVISIFFTGENFNSPKKLNNMRKKIKSKAEFMNK